MNEQGPFDRILDSSSSRDGSARLILIGMGVIGLLLLVLVLPPISLLSGDDEPGQNQIGQNQAPAGSVSAVKLPKVPEGYEALSRLSTGLSKPRDSEGPYSLTINLSQAVTDGRNIGLYTNRSGKWERLASAALVNNGTAVRGDVQEIPGNIAVLRRTVSAAQVSGYLPAGGQVDPQALEVLGTIHPADYTPAADGSLTGTATQLPPSEGSSVMPTVRAAAPGDVEAVNNILASPQLREVHIAALVQLANQPGYAGIDIDYGGVTPARKPDFTAFVSVLSERLHQSNRSLSLTLPAPVRAGPAWDSGAYDWEEIGKRADALKLVGERDPSLYYDRMTAVIEFLKSKVDLKKVALVVTRASYEKSTDGLRALPHREALSLASDMEVRTSTIAPNSSVVIVGKNIFQDDGATGLRWDDVAFAVSFAYPGRGGQRTVWIENSFSLAFKIEFAKRMGLGGIAIQDVGLDPAAAAFWEPLRAFVETGTVALAQPNGVLLRPVWQSQAGSIEPNPKGNVVWRAPPQPGAYDVSLVVSDGVIRVMQKIVIDVKAPAAATTGGSALPAAGTTPQASGTPVPTRVP